MSNGDWPALPGNVPSSSQSSQSAWNAPQVSGVRQQKPLRYGEQIYSHEASTKSEPLGYGDEIRSHEASTEPRKHMLEQICSHETNTTSWQPGYGEIHSHASRPLVYGEQLHSHEANAKPSGPVYPPPPQPVSFLVTVTKYVPMRDIGFITVT